MRSTWRPDQPYNDLPELPPPVELETKAVLKQCVTARAALAELKQAAELIPNPAMLINTLPLLEAQASSEIENIVTTADKLFRYLRIEDAADPATKEALRYRHALLEAFGTLKTFRFVRAPRNWCAARSRASPCTCAGCRARRWHANERAR